MMKHLSTWLAFGAGCATTAFVVWLTAGVEAQGPPADAIRVCVADDNVLRLANGTCPAGQRSLYFKRAGQEADAPDEPTPDAARTSALEQRIKALEQARAQGRSGLERVVAPFEVVDRSGRRVFSVEEDRVSLYHQSGKAVAIIQASDTGGRFTGLSMSGDLQASLGAAGLQSGVIITEGGRDRIYVGKQESGHYGAKFFAPNGTYVAAIGQNQHGFGLAGVYGLDQTPRALMRATDDGQHGHISIYNGETAVAELTVGRTGGGLLTIGSSSGERMVAAGVQPGNFGVVQTGPASFATAAGLPLPGSYISGKP